MSRVGLSPTPIPPAPDIRRKFINRFESNILSIYKDRGKIWLAGLGQRVSILAELWGLRELTPYNNLSYNYILSGYQNGYPIVLKLSLDESSLEKEMNALRAFSGYGGISVLNHQRDALLLQRAVPGTTLKNHPKAIQIACAVISNLNKAPIPATHHFPHVTDWLSTLDKSWKIPVEYLEKARSLKKQLLKISYQEILLHGDLHQDNILLNNNEWLVIDPKGVIGFPINETWACVEDLDNDLKYISNFFGYPLHQVIQWYYVHLILAACWQLEDNLDPSLFLSLARSVDPMVNDATRI